jgi:flagellar assembly factor FliW
MIRQGAFMHLETTRFGKLEHAPQDLLIFPEGVIGFEELKLWTLLVDHRLAWLQSAENPKIALPVITPFDFVPDYRIRLSREDWETIALTTREKPLVLSVVNHIQSQWTINLHAPILINPKQRIGIQVVTLDEQPLRRALPRSMVVLRKTA